MTTKNFKNEKPEDGIDIVFIDPEDETRWVVGWVDWYHIRIEGGPSYRHNDERLTCWMYLPKPSEVLKES